jgi:hypothetical protein
MQAVNWGYGNKARVQEWKSQRLVLTGLKARRYKAGECPRAGRMPALPRA